MSSISIAHDRHTTTTFERQEDGSIYASTNGDGVTMTASEAFDRICEALAVEPTPVLAAEFDRVYVTCPGGCGGRAAFNDDGPCYELCGHKRKEFGGTL